MHGQPTKSLGKSFQLLNTWNSLNPVLDKKHGILIRSAYFWVILLEIQVISNFTVSQIKILVFNDGKEFPTDGIFSEGSLILRNNELGSTISQQTHGLNFHFVS